MTNANKNSFWYLCFNFTRLLVLFLGNIWVSRVLGPSLFGQFTYIMSIVIYITSLDSLCHESIVKQHLSSKQDQGITLGSASFLGLALAMIATILLIAGGFFLLHEAELFLVLLLCVPAQFSRVLSPVANYFDSRLMSKYSSFALFAGALLSMLFRVTIVSYDKSLVYQGVGYSLQMLSGSAVLYILYRYKSVASHFKWQVSWGVIRSIAFRSFPIFLSAVIFLSFSLSDIFMIRHLLGVHEVGIYSIAVKLSEPWVIVSSALCTSYFPLIFSKNLSTYRQNRYFVLANQLSIYFVVILGIALMIFIDPIINILLGAQYADAALVFRVYFWSILFLFFANVQHMWEVLNGKYSVALYKTSIACLLKVGLNLVLGKEFGLMGFAVATLISFCFYGVGYNILSKTTRSYLSLQIEAFKISRLKIAVRHFYWKAKKWRQKVY